MPMIVRALRSLRRIRLRTISISVSLHGYRVDASISPGNALDRRDPAQQAHFECGYLSDVPQRKTDLVPSAQPAFADLMIDIEAIIEFEPPYKLTVPVHKSRTGMLSI